MQGLPLLNLKKNAAGQGGSPQAARKESAGSRSTLDRYESHEVKVTGQQNTSFEDVSENTEDVEDRDTVVSDMDQVTENDAENITQISERIQYLVENRGQACLGVNLGADNLLGQGEDEDYGFENFDFEAGSEAREGAGSPDPEEKGNMDEGIGVTEFDNPQLSTSTGVVDFPEDRKPVVQAEYSTGQKKGRKKRVKKTSRVKFADLEHDQGFEQMVSVAFDQEQY